MPIHMLGLVSMGLHLLDYLDLQAGIEARRWEFLLTLAPLRIAGGAGSPLNPIAMF